MLSVSVKSLWAGLNEASLETTAAAKDDMTGRREVKSRVVSKRWSLREMGMWPQEAVKGRGHWAGVFGGGGYIPSHNRRRQRGQAKIAIEIHDLGVACRFGMAE